MNIEFPLLEAHNKVEEEIVVFTTTLLGESLDYFHYIQETLLMAFGNAGKPLEVETSVNNPKIFALVASTRAFSIAKSAMDLAVRGYPIIASALTRFLSEIVQSTQYLVRHPGKIDYYFSGGLPLNRILKFAKEEASTNPEAFGLFWGLQSRFSHATPDFLSLTLKIENSKMSSSLVIQDPKIIEDVAYGIMGGLYLQYLIYRIVTRNCLAVESALAERDQIIFDPENIRKFLGFSSLSDDFLNKAYEWLCEGQSQ